MRLKVLVSLVTLVLLSSAAAYAYTAATGSAVLTVKEPIGIYEAMITTGGASPTTIGSCTVAQQTVSCTADVYAGESGVVNIRLRNNANVPITVTQTASSSSPDVTLAIVNPTASIAAAPSGAFLFQITFEVSPSAAPGSATITTAFNR